MRPCPQWPGADIDAGWRPSGHSCFKEKAKCQKLKRRCGLQGQRPGHWPTFTSIFRWKKPWSALKREVPGDPALNARELLSTECETGHHQDHSWDVVHLLSLCFSVLNSCTSRPAQKLEHGFGPHYVVQATGCCWFCFHRNFLPSKNCIRILNFLK